MTYTEEGDIVIADVMTLQVSNDDEGAALVDAAASGDEKSTAESHGSVGGGADEESQPRLAPNDWLCGCRGTVPETRQCGYCCHEIGEACGILTATKTD